MKPDRHYERAMEDLIRLLDPTGLPMTDEERQELRPPSPETKRRIMKFARHVRRVMRDA